MTDQAFLVNPSANTQRETKTIKAASAYRTISEASDELGVPQHVLRFWETKFSQIRPMKRSGGRRFYRPEDIDLIRTIQSLLYDQGYTIKGVQRLLKMRKGITTTLQAALDDMGEDEAFDAIAPAPIDLKPIIEMRPTDAVTAAAADVVMNLAEELTELTDDLSPQAAFDLFTSTPLHVLEQIPDHLPAKPARLMATGLAAGHPLPAALAEELADAIAAQQPAPVSAPIVAPGISTSQRAELSALLAELKELKALLN